MSPANVTGGTNYWIPVYSSLKENVVPVVLWFFDTHD